MTIKTCNYVKLLTIAICTFLTLPSFAMSDDSKSSAKATGPNYNDPILNRISLPPGFRINYFIKNIKDARSMALGSRGTVFVGSRSAGTVYALNDTNNDGFADKKVLIAKDLNMPNGIAFYKNDLYVAEVNQILIFRNIEKNLKFYSKPEVFFADLPIESHHGWRYIRVGPDNHLYIAIGAPCNVCDEKGYAKIKRLNLKSKKLETIAHGIRNSVGFDWHPITNQLWFSDNGRDMMGDNIPPDEINRLSKAGQHFGYPYCHGETVLDPEFGKNKNCKHYRAPEVKLQAHVAPLGIRFYTGTQFPKKYQKQLFVAEHGSWNRSSKVGYQIRLIEIKDNKVISSKPFATGWLQKQKTYGRPVDFLNMVDGSLLLSDDFRGVIYRISYSKP